jgi:hypothetical protein
MKNWSEIQRSYPFFWLWLNAWLKSKGADDVTVLNDDVSSEYVKVRFSIPSKVRELSNDMIHEALDEAGIRICVTFDTENTPSAWQYVIHKKGLNDLWTQIYTSTYIFNKRDSVNEKGLMHGISEVDKSLKKQNAVGQY